jgi:hypothetical protein
MKRLYHEMTEQKNPLGKKAIHLTASIPAAVLSVDIHPWLFEFT